MDSLLPFDSILHLTNGLQQGEYIVGPSLPAVSPSPVRNIVEYLAKRTDDQKYVTLKVLCLSPQGDDCQGKLLIHNEHSILSLLQDQNGVIHHHGLFKHKNYIILVLDCLYTYDHHLEQKDYINLQQYVIKEKRFPERDALKVFYQLVNVVKNIHEKKIIHRDLKLGNVIINRRTQEVILTNFALSKHLVREGDLVSDQRGSLAYVSPDVLNGQPYDGKASDMWSLGVLLFTMISGQFPFYDSIPQELFRKIKNGRFALPKDVGISMETEFLLRQLIELDPRKRLTASAAVDATQNVLSRISYSIVHEPVQIVPEIDSSQCNELAVPTSPYSSHINVSELTAPQLQLQAYMESMDTTWNVQRVSPTGGGVPLSPSSSLPLFMFPEPSPSSFSSVRPTLPQHHPLPVPHPRSFSSPYPQASLHPNPHIHRHSFSEGDPTSNLWLRRLLLTTPTAPPPATNHRRSLGSMVTQEFVVRNRRHSHSYNLLVPSDGQRVRRRSHEPTLHERDMIAQAHGGNPRPHSANTNSF